MLLHLLQKSANVLKKMFFRHCKFTFSKLFQTGLIFVVSSGLPLKYQTKLERFVRENTLAYFASSSATNQTYDNSGLYYKPMMIVNDYSRVINKFETSLTDDARVIIYDRHMFIVQATDVNAKKFLRQCSCRISPCALVLGKFFAIQSYL